MDADARLLHAIARKAVRSVVRYSVSNASGPFDESDMYSDAMLGVAHAHRSWNPDKGPFAFYARIRAIGAVRDGIRERGVVSRSEWDKGMRQDDVGMERRNPLPLPVLLEEGFEPVDTERGANEVDGVAAVEAVLAQLPERLALVVRATVLEDYTLGQVGLELGLTESRVCQLRKEAMGMLRHMDLSGLV